MTTILDSLDHSCLMTSFHYCGLLVSRLTFSRASRRAATNSDATSANCRTGENLLATSAASRRMRDKIGCLLARTIALLKRTLTRRQPQKADFSPEVGFFVGPLLRAEMLVESLRGQLGLAKDSAHGGLAESAVQKSHPKGWAAVESFDPCLLRQPSGKIQQCDGVPDS